MSNRVNFDQLIVNFRKAARATDFLVQQYGEAFGYPLLAATRTTKTHTSDGKNVYISTGIHGDEPAPPYALLELMQNDRLPCTNNYFICPCMNPAGLAAGTRENPEGVDLNRDYTKFASQEIRTHRDWVESEVESLNLAVHLHEDWEAQGFYFYELNFNGQRSQAKHILSAAAEHLPIERAVCIDGHRNSGGVISPPTVPVIPEGHPEAIYFQQRFGLLDYTLETPSSFDFEKRVACMQAALLAAIGSS